MSSFLVTSSWRISLSVKKLRLLMSLGAICFQKVAPFFSVTLSHVSPGLSNLSFHPLSSPLNNLMLWERDSIVAFRDGDFSKIELHFISTGTAISFTFLRVLVFFSKILEAVTISSALIWGLVVEPVGYVEILLLLCFSVCLQAISLNSSIFLTVKIKGKETEYAFSYFFFF